MDASSPPSDELARSLFAYALQAGADECELVRADRRTTTVRITDSVISETKQVTHSGYGIRLVKKRRITSAFTTDSERLFAMVDAMTSASNDAYSPCEPWRGLAEPSDHTGEIPGTYDRRLDGITCAEADEIATRMICAASPAPPHSGQAVTVTGSLNIVSETFTISNTNQLHDSERSTYVSGMINVDAADRAGGSAGSSYEPPVSGMGHSSARTLAGFDPERAGRDARSMCLRSLNPVSIGYDDSDGSSDSRYTIVFEPYSVGELLSFALSASFELKCIVEGRSFLSSRSRGDTVSSELLSILDDPHAPDAMGSHRIDAEGVRTLARRPLISSGRFDGAYSDLFGYYMASASDDITVPRQPGNASRAAVPAGRGADPIPFSAPHNMSVVSSRDRDKVPVDELVSGVKRGLLVGRLWYTYAVNPIRGDFSCTARSGIALIRNGRVTRPVKPVRIMHSLPRLLMDVSGVGDDTRNVIQWASLSSVTPSIRVENVPVMRIS